MSVGVVATLFCLILGPVSPASADQAAAAGQPQPKLQTVTLTVSGKSLEAEVADDPEEMEAGMMFRTEMPKGTAMVFVLGAPRQAGFWMRNTLVPLSVAYLNATGMILEIYDLEPKNETPVVSKFETIAYAIEVPQGWFGRNGILPGAMVRGLPSAPRR